MNGLNIVRFGCRHARSPPDIPGNGLSAVMGRSRALRQRRGAAVGCRITPGFYDSSQASPLKRRGGVFEPASRLSAAERPCSPSDSFDWFHALPYQTRVNFQNSSGARYEKNTFRGAFPALDFAFAYNPQSPGIALLINLKICSVRVAIRNGPKARKIFPPDLLHYAHKSLSCGS